LARPSVLVSDNALSQAPQRTLQLIDWVSFLA
jgi:hypothetical protein